MPNDFLKEIQEKAAENLNAQQQDNNLMDAEQFMGQFGYKPNEETANNSWGGWVKDAIDSGVAGVLGGQAKLAETFLGVGGDAANYFGDVAKRNARTKEYNSGDIVPFASDYYTNPQGFAYDAGNLIGSMIPLAGEAAALTTAAAPVLSGLGYEGLSAAAGALAGRAASAGMPALANVLRSKVGTLILANVVKTPFEVASEMGNTVEDMENKGASLDEQKKAAIINGLVQMPLLTLSNTVEGMGLGSLIGSSTKTAAGKAAKAAAGIAGGAAQQSWEEGMQAASSNYASGDRDNLLGIVNPADWKEDEIQQAAAAFAPGMLFGGLGVGAGHVAHKMGAISDLSDNVKGSGGGTPPDGYPKDDSAQYDNSSVFSDGSILDNVSNADDLANIGNNDDSGNGSSIVENMAALTGVMPYHVPEGTTCMRSVSTAVRNATGGAWPQIDYVPTAIEKAQEMGLWHDADYQPKAGDIAIVNGDNHAVMYDGEGGTWQSGESHNGIYHSTQSPTEMFGKVTGWISTSDLANGKGTNSTYSSQNAQNAQNNMTSVMDFLKENQFANDTDANNDITDALESGNDEKMFKVAEKLGYKPLIEQTQGNTNEENKTGVKTEIEPEKLDELFSNEHDLVETPRKPQMRTVANNIPSLMNKKMQKAISDPRMVDLAKRSIQGDKKATKVLSMVNENIRQALLNTIAQKQLKQVAGKEQQILQPQQQKEIDDFKNKVAQSHSGKSTQVVTDDGTEFNAQYKVIDADNIIASNKADNSFAPNKLYPSELQPRNRASVAMQGQVRQMAANLRTADLGESRNLNTGAPLINDNGVVENGNGRVMAITRALKGGNEAGKNYKKYLVDNADKYGLDAAIIQGMKSPVLVRQRLDDVDTNKIITSTAGGAVMGATEQGLSDAKRLDTNTLRKYVANDNGDLTTGGNRNFVISALKDIVGKDMGKFNALLTADGDVSQQGITRVRNALFAKAYKDNGLLAIMSESTDNNIRNITNAMLNAAPYIAEIQARMSNGSLYDYNLSGEVTAACKKLVKLRDEGKPVSTYLVEQSMFGEELSDTAKDIISFLDRNKNSAKKINAMLQRASKLVEDLGDPNQGQLYGEVKMPTVSEIYNKSIGDVEGEESNSQGELFNAGTKSGTGKASSEENQMGNGVLEGKYGSNETSQQDKQTIQDERPSVQQKEVTEKNSTKNNRSEKNESGISMPQKNHGEKSVYTNEKITANMPSNEHLMAQEKDNNSGYPSAPSIISRKNNVNTKNVNTVENSPKAASGESINTEKSPERLRGFRLQLPDLLTKQSSLLKESVAKNKETVKDFSVKDSKPNSGETLSEKDGSLVQAAKESFPTAKNIVSNGSSVSFELPNGSKMTIDLVKGIVATVEDRERASKEHGIPVTSNDQLQGSMRTIGIDGLMQLTRDSEKGTIDHEAMEFAKKIAFTPKENADMDRLLPGKEAQCNAYRDWQKQGKGRLGKLWRKIQDIINQVKAYLGSVEAKSRIELEKYYKQVASGEVFNNQPHNGNNTETVYNTNGNEAETRLKIDAEKWKSYGVQFKENVQKALDNKIRGNKVVKVCDTPLILQALEIPNLPIKMHVGVAANVTKEKGTTKHAHNLTLDMLEKIPEALNNPVFVMKSATHEGDIVVLTDIKNNNGLSIAVPLILQKDIGRGNTANIIKSIYGRENEASFIERQIKNNNLLYANTEKSPEWLRGFRLQLPDLLTTQSFLLEKSIAKNKDAVKDFSAKDNLSQADIQKSSAGASSQRLQLPKALLEQSSLLRNRSAIGSLYNNVPKRAGNDSSIKRSINKNYASVNIKQEKTNYEGALSDENGKPLVFFHGTPKAFDSYDMNEKERTNNGEQGLVWFTDSKKAADSFSYEKLDSKKSSFIQEKGQKGVVKQANLIMQQPLDLRNLSDKDMQNLWTLPGLKKEFASYNEFTDKMRHWSEIGNSRLMKVTILSSVENPVKEYNKHIRALQKMGYDGIIADMGKEYNHASEYGVFDTKQIKEIPSADIGQENKNIAKSYDENSGPKFNVSKKSIADYVNVVLANPGKKLRLKLGKVSVSEAKVIRASTGLDVEGYEHVWKSNDVRHVEKRHGIGNEKQVDQIGLSKEEMVEAIYAIKNPNKIEKGTPTNNGEPSIRFVQTTDNNHYTAVEVVRDTNKTLYIKTIWKKAINKHHDDNDVALLDTSKTAIDSPSSVEQRLPQKNQAVNYEEKKDSATDVSYSVKSSAGEFIKKLSTGDTGKDKEEKLDTPEARGNAAVSHNPKAPIKQRIMDVKKDFYKNWIDSLEPINKLQKQIEIIAGEKLDYEHDVYKQARMANSFAIGRANMLVSGENPKEVIKAINQTMKTDAKLKNDVTLQSVFEIIPDKEMKSKYAEYFKRGGFKNSHDVLSTYLMSARLLELQDAKRQNINRLVKEMSATRKDLRSTEKERESKLEALEKELKEWNSVPEYKGPISNSDARAIVENAPEEFQRAANAYYKFNDNTLAIAEDAGLISHETHAMLNEKYSHYAPMLRDFSDTAAFDKFMGALGGKGVVNVTTFLKRITKFGSERKVIDPLESTIKNLFAICDKAERNKVAQIFVNLSEDNKAGKFAMPVEATSSDPNNSIFTVMVNGEKQAFKTDPEFYGALAGYTEAPATIVSSLFKSTAQALRTGATISPDFIVRNLVRDTIFAGISSKTGFVPVIDSAKGMWALKHDKQLVEEFKAAGVPMSNFVGSNRRSAASTLDKMAGGDKSWRTMPIKKLVSTLYEAVQDASELAESGTRMGEFMRARKQGLSIEEAGFLAKELTLDFGRSGIYGRKVNSAVPFFNACIQGSDKMYRLLRYNPRKTTIALAKYIMLPSLMLWAMNYDKDWYKELPDDVKNGSWVWKVGDTIFRLPKPQEAGVLFGSGMERFLDACANNDPKAVADWAKYMLDVLSPNVLPTLVLPLLEWKTNYSFFTGKAVVGRREQNLPDDKQYNIYTTEFAKFLGRNTNTSPEKWDNTIKGYFGTAGAFVAQSMDNLFGTEYTKAEKLWSEQPGIKGFTFTAGKRSKSVEEWYEIYNEISKEHSANGIKGHPAFYVKQANSLNKKLGELSKASTTVIMNKNLSPEQKRQYLDNIDSKKVQLAKLGVQRYRKYVKD